MNIKANFKRFIAIALMLILALCSMTGCGGNKSQVGSKESNPDDTITEEYANESDDEFDNAGDPVEEASSQEPSLELKDSDVTIRIVNVNAGFKKPNSTKVKWDTHLSVALLSPPAKLTQIQIDDTSEVLLEINSNYITESFEYVYTKEGRNTTDPGIRFEFKEQNISRYSILFPKKVLKSETSVYKLNIQDPSTDRSWTIYTTFKLS